MRIQFAERFVADLEAGELFRNGRLRPLQDLPFRFLELLLARPGRVVTYDEIGQSLWHDVNVNRRDGIKEAAQKLRRALGADASRLECLRGRGYRLMASVIVLHDQDSPAPFRTSGNCNLYLSTLPAESARAQASQ